MKLYDYYRSSASYRVRIALNLKQINYESLPINLANNGGEQHRLDYLELNPQGLVPTLVENGHILTQSLAIIEYLDEINPEPPLLPSNPLERASIRSLSLIIASDIHPLNNLRVLNQLRSQFDASDEQITDWYHLWLKNGFDAFESKLMKLPRKKPVCLGSEVTLADICLVPQVYNAKRFKFNLDNYPMINKINDYCMTLPEFSDASPDKKRQA